MQDTAKKTAQVNDQETEQESQQATTQNKAQTKTDGRSQNQNTPQITDDELAGVSQNIENLKEQLAGEELAKISQKIEVLEQQLSQAKERELRAQADYNNLQRRSKEEQSRIVKLAAKAMVEDLLESIEHLSMAADQLKNSILDMVLTQLWAALREHGLEELQVMGEPFDLQTMEAVDLVDGATENEGVVVKVIKRGYTLNGQVIQHAKVVMGKK